MIRVERLDALVAADEARRPDPVVAPEAVSRLVDPFPGAERCVALERVDDLDEQLLARSRSSARRQIRKVAEPDPAEEAARRGCVELRALLRDLSLGELRVPSAMPVRMMLTPAAATAASPFPPPGLARSAGGAFERAIGNSLRPPVTRAPVAASIVTFATERAYRRPEIRCGDGTPLDNASPAAADRRGRVDRRLVFPRPGCKRGPALDPVFRLCRARAELPHRGPPRAAVPTTRGRIPQTKDIDEFGGEGWLAPMLVRIEGQDVWIPAGGKSDEEVEELIEESRERLLQGESAHSPWPQPPSPRFRAPTPARPARGSRGGRRARVRALRARPRPRLGRARQGRPATDRGAALLRGGTDRRARR